MGRACNKHEGEEDCIQGFYEKFKRKETTKKIDVGRRIILKYILEEQDGVVWTALIWLRTGSRGGLL
jgi:hypothetical protein